MKICSNCSAQLEDSAKFCNICGMQIIDAQPQDPQPQPQEPQPQQPPFAPPEGYQYQQPPIYAPQPVIDPYDHTSEFDAEDISENKVICMCVYLLSTLGIIIALLVGNSSKYTAFHVRQALKLTVISALGTLACVVLCWTFIVPLAYVVLMGAVLVARIICFIQICKGEAKEAIIARKLNFMK